MRSTSKSQMLWVDSIRSIRATAHGGKERVLRKAGSCPRQRHPKPSIPSGFDEEGHRAVVHELDLHMGCKFAAGDGRPEVAQRPGEGLDQPPRPVGRPGGGPRGATAGAGVAGARELADDEGTAADSA